MNVPEKIIESIISRQLYVNEVKWNKEHRSYALMQEIMEFEKNEEK